MTVYEPEGFRFYDMARQCEMLLVAEGEPYAGMLCWRHPDGQWVTMREATAADIAILTQTQETAPKTEDEDVWQAFVAKMQREAEQSGGAWFPQTKIQKE